jgi:hypothetical protein
MHATYGIVPVGLFTILAISRSLGIVKMAQKKESARNKPNETEMSNLSADQNKEKTN